MRSTLVSLVLAAGLMACVGDSPVAGDTRPVGSQGGRCFSNGTCDKGLVCVVPDTCVVPSAGEDAGKTPVIDAGDAGDAGDAAACSLLAWWRGAGDPSDERNLYGLSWVAGAQYASGFDLVGTNFLVGQKKLGAASLTIEARIRPITPDGTILATDKEDGSGGGIWFGLSAGRVSARINKSWCQGNAPMVASSWHHVAVSYGAGTCVLYLDGKQDQLVAVPAGPIADELPPYVGANASGAVQTAMFHGVIAELAVWSRVLGPSEVAALAQESPPTKCR